MKQIKTKVWSHLSLKDNVRYAVKDIRESIALEVDTFSDLVKHIANISYQNAEFALFFRAQTQDHINRFNCTTIYPSIYRMPHSKRYDPKIVRDRFLKLEKAEEKLLNAFKTNRYLGVSKLTKFREMKWAILQHYEICETPLLDITQSLRVACSFALDKKADDPYIFVLGLPYPNGSISYYVEEELLNIKLLSICPPRALRPYFQEGYLIGNFPTSEETRSGSYDIARRLIAKFQLKRETFADKNFNPLQHDTLFPPNDSIKRICESIKTELS